MKNHLTRWHLQSNYAALPKRFYSPAKESEFSAPSLLLWNEKLAKELGLSEIMQAFTAAEKAELFVGKVFPEGSRPLAMAYAGHQFGHFAILGDGRAMLLGEWEMPNQQKVDIHLKGSGITPYSRSGDGIAALSPVLREYLISEAMFAMGIPTTRSLAVVLTGDSVFRDGIRKGAVLTRVAQSHLRVGTMQFACLGGREDIKALADFAILRHYPHLLSETDSAHRYLLFFDAVIKKQAELIAKWQLTGFIHGVMNTDNMTISGETIDYGPCAFMDEYDAKTVFSSIDTQGRYRYENQPVMGKWNLARLAESLLELFDPNQEVAIGLATAQLEEFEDYFETAYSKEMSRKLGLSDYKAADQELFAELLRLMQKHRSDFTNTFVRLTLETGGEDGIYLEGTESLFADIAFSKWKESWQNRQMESEPDKNRRLQRMKTANPFVIPRNHRVEEALQQFENGNPLPYQNLFQVLQSPYSYSFADREYQKLSPRQMCGYQTFCGT